MITDVVIAGLNLAGFDTLRSISERRLAPSGKLFAFPVKRAGYPKEQALRYQEAMRDRILALPEKTRISLTVAYVDYGDESTQAFIAAFQPFALIRPLNILTDEFESVHARNRAVKDYGEYLADEAKELRARASRVSEFTHIRNISPYLLPYRNFSSRHYREMVERLYHQLGTTEDISSLMQAEANRLAQHHPRVTPPSQHDSCYSDGKLYFRSPGRDRHGYFRHASGKGHDPSCLLNARSRFGGSFDHDLHYDCLPVKRLADRYPNCHGEPSPSKNGYVNICPNDYII